MLPRIPSFAILIFLFLLPASKTFAQQKEDTLTLKNNTPDTSGKSLLALDTAVKKKHNPKIATFRSAVLPGWGQAYNKKYWKIPIVYGALGTTAGVFLYNIKTYRLLRKAVIYRLDKDTSNDNLIAPEFATLSTESIRFYRNAYRQNIDYSVLVFLIFWGLNVVDATVDAHLKAFDVSPDIGMKVRPGVNQTTNGVGLSLVFFLKDKNARPLLPLP
jgi:hypothetical protein